MNNKYLRKVCIPVFMRHNRIILNVIMFFFILFLYITEKKNNNNQTNIQYIEKILILITNAQH